jgi:tetratricopeptide (TPR) repeat protein
LNKGSLLLLSAKTLGDLGLDGLAERAIERMVQLQADSGQALLFLADLQQIRGRLSEADATLDRLNKMPNVGDAVRSELASAFERVGRQDKAIEVMEAIRASRKTVAEDLEMRLAWLYSEVGDEEKALEQWLALWRKLKSIPRRRYVEDRLMTVASRLGTLADIAVKLEEKLADGKADEREAGLLVRIYSRVNDSVAASEILEEYMTQSGRNEVERLQEKGRIYQVCNDYWNYEKVIERLIEVDPEGKTEYLRQLALSMLERGKAQDARAVLVTLRDADDGRDSIGGEFEAGVLALVGMRRGAADAYRRGIATHPDRIESYLLLANLLKEMGETDRAVGMFQYLAENAKQDDLFTIAIDGLLNMEARGRVMQWARRITLERLAGRDDKNYLYQLLADLSAEVNDKTGQIRAMENSLAVSGNRRLSVLRECMDLSSNIRGGVFYQRSASGPTNAGNKPFLAFGRRLIGLGELMPPQVFLDLGQAFLAAGDTASAERTFGLARKQANERGYQREVAQIFEKAGKRAEALVRYDRLLRTSPSDVALMARVAKLNEQEGKDAIACRFYEHGLNLLIAQTPLTTRENSSNKPGVRFWGGNRDAYQTYSDRLLRGVLVTVPDDRIDALLNEQRSLLDDNLKQLTAAAAAGRGAKTLAEAPRIHKQSIILRRLYYAFARQENLQELDLELIRHFKNDRTLLVKFATDHISRNWYNSAEWLLNHSEPDAQQRRQILTLLGQSLAVDQSGQALTPKEMWQRLLPVWMSGDNEEARRILRRVDRSKGITNERLGYVTYVMVNGVMVPRQPRLTADVSAWTRLAIQLGDEGLALTFARSQLQHKSRYGARNVKQMFESYRNVLPADSFRSLVRFAANLYRNDDKRVVEYLWLVSNLGAEIGGELPTDEELLKLVEDGNLRLNYQFPFQQAMEAFPESIRDKALEILIERIDKKSRPRELISIPFHFEEPLGENISKIILDAIASGIQPALQDKYLRYISYYLGGSRAARARKGKAVACDANSELAIAALDLLSAKNVHSQNPQIAGMAKMIKAVVLHQNGRSDEALEIVLESYDPDRPIKDTYQRYVSEWAKNELVPFAPDRFLAKLDKLSKTSKSIQHTDRRLVLARLAQDEELLRATYEQAWKDHPTQSKYPQQYDRWEQRAGRIGNSIAINNRLLETKKSKKNVPARQPVPVTLKSGDRGRLVEDLQRTLNARLKPVPNLLVDGDFGPKTEELVMQFQRLHKLPASGMVNTATRKAMGLLITQTDIQIVAIERRLGELWFLAGHSINGLAHWIISDDHDLIRFEQKQKMGNMPQKPPSKPSVPLKRPAPTVIRKVPNAIPSITSGIAKLKSAMKSGNDAEAGQILRQLWRAFPQVVESPYGYRMRQKNFNGLRWPSDLAPRIVKEPDEDEIRRRLRGGLATFETSTRKKTSTAVPDSIWKILAAEPFGIAEMKRILRSRSAFELDSVDEVALGLLLADRRARGDDVVFEELVGAVKQGRVGSVEWNQLLAMIEKNPARINSENQFMVEELVKKTDLSQLNRVSRLAWLCGKIGQKKRSASLFVHCSLLAQSKGVTFTSLIKKAREIFKGDELMALAERMFEVAVTNDAAISTMLDLRIEILDAEQVARKSSELFAKLDSDPTDLSTQQARYGVQIFSRASQFQKARQCLKAAMLSSSKPIQNPSPYYNSGVRPRTRLTRVDLIEMFPQDGTAFDDYAKWLTEAAQEVRQIVSDEKFDTALSVELLLIIAIRQVQQNAIEAATLTLGPLLEKTLGEQVLEKAKTHELLAIDVLHLAKQYEPAYKLQYALYKCDQLSPVRYGDLLRDTLRVKGKNNALVLLEELLLKSLHEDLLEVALEIHPPDSPLSMRIIKLRQQSQAADAEYRKRSEAARQRDAKRSGEIKPADRKPGRKSR